LSQTHTHTRTHARTHARTHTQTHTHTRTHTHTQTPTHTPHNRHLDHPNTEKPQTLLNTFYTSDCQTLKPHTAQNKWPSLRWQACVCVCVCVCVCARAR